jgi:hypothetical protein
MKLQTIALGLTLAVAGSAFAATHETTVTRVTPNGTVTKHIVRNDRDDMYQHRHVKKVVIVHPQRHYNHRVVVMHPQYRPAKKVVIVHPAHHGHYAQNRTVVIHRNAS